MRHLLPHVSDRAALSLFASLSQHTRSIMMSCRTAGAVARRPLPPGRPGGLRRANQLPAAVAEAGGEPHHNHSSALVPSVARSACLQGGSLGSHCWPCSLS